MLKLFTQLLTISLALFAFTRYRRSRRQLAVVPAHQRHN
ncbi:Putative uncharacterized protein [Lactobacillus delbrueckii subsp. lactis]|nr:Putative uncharacterized protein [Lactobacillus delbrueckii subsp. lactis]